MSEDQSQTPPETTPEPPPEPLDPNSDPVSMKGLTGVDLGTSFFALVAAVVPALAIGLILAGGSVRRTMGATVSHNLEWQRRQAEIEAVIAKADGIEQFIEQDVVND
jgi:hypothetical protein